MPLGHEDLVGLVGAAVAEKQIEISHGNQEQWVRSRLRRHEAAGLQLEFAGANTIFHPQDFARAPFEDVEAALFTPFRG